MTGRITKPVGKLASEGGPAPQTIDVEPDADISEVGIGDATKESPAKMAGLGSPPKVTRENPTLIRGGMGVPRRPAPPE